MLAPFSLQDNTALAFDGPATTVTTSGLNVTFTFKTNRPSLVYYRLVINVNQVRVSLRVLFRRLGRVSPRHCYLISA